jgi:hypothetical protein
MGRKLIVLLVLLGVVAAFAATAGAQTITKVVRRNPDNNSGDTEPVVAPDPLGEKSLSFVDRTHVYVTVPEILLGVEYIMTCNDDKDNPNYEMDVTVSKPTRMYLFIDNRVGTDVSNSPTTTPNLAAANMNWVTNLGFVDTGINMAIDESNDGTINQWFSIFALDIPAGTITLRAQNTGHNMYGVAVAEPPVKARKPSPADGEQGVTSPLFTWTAGSGAVLHDVYLGTSPDLGVADLVSSHKTGLFYYHAIGLTPGTTYYWRVDEIEADLKTVHTGDVWSFTAASLTAWQPAPADGAKWVVPNTELNWKAGKDGITHDVYLSKDKAAVETGATEAFQASLYLGPWKPPLLEVGTTYYWRVDEVAADNTKVTGVVWSFTTLPATEITDPSLRAWWKMDEGSDITVVDWSGHGNHGIIVGDAQRTVGYANDALSFDGAGDYVDCGNSSTLDFGTDDWTVTAWIKTKQSGTGDANKGTVYGKGGDQGGGYRYAIGIDEVTSEKMTVTTDDNVTKVQATSTASVNDDRWRHIAGMRKGTELLLYIDGVLDVVDGPVTVTADYNLAGSSQHNAYIGCIMGRDIGQVFKFFRGQIDDVRVYAKALTPEEVQMVMRVDPLAAWNPSPANGVLTDIIQAVPLTWQAGDKATRHDVYLGEDRAAVAAADAADTTGIYRGRQSGTSFTPSPALGWGKTYFWRVDEINGDGSISTGFIWSFSIADFLIVDDFESYNDEENQNTRIYETWLDGLTNGTTSTVGYWDPPFAERTIVHGGQQSMPIDYNNILLPFYAEAEREFIPVQDWTVGGVTDLVVWFRGRPVTYAENAGTITMSGSGHDIWDNADDFRFAWKRLSGNGSIMANVESLVNTNTWAKAGVMIRQSLDADSKFAYMVVSAAQGVSFGWRQLPAGTCGSATQTGVAAPQWVKLTRTGDVFTAQYSADGKNWLDVKNTDGTVASTTIAMTGASIYIGLCVTSHDAAQTTTAVFSGAATTGTVTGSNWQVSAIGDDPELSNSAQNLYVIVEDSGGKSKVITHPDPAATTVRDWTEWKIPLGDLTGVSLTKVKRLYIGVGDAQNAVADGDGRIYIDDIRLIVSP